MSEDLRPVDVLRVENGKDIFRKGALDHVAGSGFADVPALLEPSVFRPLLYRGAGAGGGSLHFQIFSGLVVPDRVSAVTHALNVEVLRRFEPCVKDGCRAV